MFGEKRNCVARIKAARKNSGVTEELIFQWRKHSTSGSSKQIPSACTLLVLLLKVGWLFNYQDADHPATSYLVHTLLSL